jgi:hypothetical protein
MQKSDKKKLTNLDKFFDHSEKSDLSPMNRKSEKNIGFSNTNLAAFNQSL